MLSYRIRPLREDEVRFSVFIVPEDVTVRGNALVSGDAAVDRAAEDAILERLNLEDLWAWCTVFVTAQWQGFEGTDSLGCCSYADEAEFRSGDYFTDMKARALESLNQQLGLVGELVEVAS